MGVLRKEPISLLM